MNRRERRQPCPAMFSPVFYRHIQEITSLSSFTGNDRPQYILGIRTVAYKKPRDDAVALNENPRADVKWFAEHDTVILRRPE
mgnify:CR=1 FL=1